MGVASSDVFTPGASTFEGRLSYVLTRATDKVGPATKAQLLELVSPESLQIIAAVLTAWIVAHACGRARAKQISEIASSLSAT